jgi:hypothetical protein
MGRRRREARSPALGSGVAKPIRARCESPEAVRPGGKILCKRDEPYSSHAGAKPLGGGRAW